MGIAGRTSLTGSFGSGHAVLPTLRGYYVECVLGHYEPMSTSVNKTLNLPMALVEPCIMDHRPSSFNECWSRSHAPWLLGKTSAKRAENSETCAERLS